MADISSLSVFAVIQDSGLRITLMEIKMPGACLLWLAHILNDSGIYPTSFSKYGTCYKNLIISREGFLSA